MLMSVSTYTLPTNLQDDLVRVEQIIHQRLQGRAIVAQIAAPHTTFAEAQRLRIALVLLSAQLGSYQFERTVHAAAAVGLIMAASSLHGGLVDPAARRQHAVSAWPGVEVNVPLMVGDYLFALAAAEMALAPDPRIIAYYSRSVMAFCEATLTPISANDPAEALAQHTAGVTHSAATLAESACKAGGVCGGLAQEQIDALGRFGYEFGRALLIHEEITHLDHTLSHGIISTPLIYAAEATGSQILALHSQHPHDLRLYVEKAGGIARAEAQANAYCEQARAALLSLPEQPSRLQLAALVR
jgi:heptaprenyl diphosphate synthase